MERHPNKYYYKSEADSVMDAMEERIKMLEGIRHAKDQLAEKYNKVRELVSGKNIEEVCDNILALKSELKRTKRTLWLARAERAGVVCEQLMCGLIACDQYNRWSSVERKCRAYADKFKEDK